jgi:hypothetical protein
MAAKKYKCTNFANCDAALSKEVIEIEDGEEVVCPTCKEPKSLLPAEADSAKTGTGGSSPMKRVLIGVGVVAVIALAWMLIPSGPRPEAASAMVLDFFPRLK